MIREKIIPPVTLRNYDMVNTNMYKASPIDQLPLDTVTDEEGNTLHVIQNDIALLFNQERLNNLGEDNVKKFLDSLTPKSNALAELRKKCSDKDLVNLCKSRYLQTPSEILAWSNYLNNNYSTLVNEIRVEAEQKQLEQQQQVENNTTVSPNVE